MGALKKPAPADEYYPKDPTYKKTYGVSLQEALTRRSQFTLAESLLTDVHVYVGKTVPINIHTIVRNAGGSVLTRMPTAKIMKERYADGAALSVIGVVMGAGPGKGKGKARSKGKGKEKADPALAKLNKLGVPVFDFRTLFDFIMSQEVDMSQAIQQ